MFQTQPPQTPTQKIQFNIVPLPGKGKIPVTGSVTPVEHIHPIWFPL